MAVAVITFFGKSTQRHDANSINFHQAVLCYNKICLIKMVKRFGSHK